MQAQIYALIDYESDGINDKVYNIWTASAKPARNNNYQPSKMMLLQINNMYIIQILYITSVLMMAKNISSELIRMI